MKKIILFTLFYANAVVSFAQSRVTGTVKGETGEPIYGAVVKVKGTSRATTTDFDGKYSIEASSSDVLEISSVGMSNREVSVGTQSVIDVTMGDDVQQLGNVVVTALGISRDEKSLGYSVQQLGGEELSQARESNPINSLSGKIAGVNISSSSGNLGGSSRVTIRGISSITGQNNPLYVIDGVPIDNSDFNSSNTARGAGGIDYGNMAQDINSDDIESISVLKGAAAAALYGSRAANGVILVTTKKGKKANDKIGISVNSSIDISTINNSLFPDLQDKYGGGGSEKFSLVKIDETYYRVVDFVTDESWGPKFDGQQVLHWDAFYEELEDRYLKTRPWQASPNDVETFFNPQITLRNNVSFSGGKENTTYRLSYSNMYTPQGYLPNSTLNKNTLSLAGSSKLSDKLNIQGTLTYVNNMVQNRPVTGYHDDNVMQKFIQWGQRQLDMKILEKYWEKSLTEQRTWNRTSWDDATPKYSDNPYWTMYRNYSNDQRDRVYGNALVSYNILENLNLIVRTSGDVYTFRTEERIAVGSQSTSTYKKDVYSVSEFNNDFLLSYNDKFDNLDLDLNANFGGNVLYRLYQHSSGQVDDLAIPGIYNLTNAIYPPLTTDEITKKAINSLYGNVSLGYKRMLYLEVAMRNDWSSTLPKDNYSFFYPSLSTSFVFTELPFFKDNTAGIIDFGKLRGSISQVGNDTDPYRLEQVYFPDENGGFNGNASFRPSTTLYNPNLKPEITTEYEIGLEMKFFENRLGFDFSWYYKNSVNQIISLPVTPTYGYSNVTINAGKIVNNGIELMLYGTPIKTEDFSWDINLNVSQNNNSLESLIEGVDDLLLESAPFEASVRATVGEGYGQLWVRDFMYDKDGNRVVNKSGRYLSSELKPVGSVVPDARAGLKNTFTYKGLSLGVLIDAQFGGKYFSTSYMFGTYAGMLEHTAEGNIREDGVVLDATVAKYDADGNIVTDDNGIVEVTGKNTKNISASRWARDHRVGPGIQNVFDASYFKLREITLGYTFKIKDYNIDNLRVAVYGRNLFAWGLSNPGFDPEFSNSSGNIQGIEGGLVPSLSTYGMSVSFNI